MSVKIFVWMPSWTGYPHPDAILNIFNQKLHKDYELEFTMNNIIANKPIHIARNELLERFIHSWCDYMLRCDDDNPMELDVLQKLLDTKKDIVSAIVPLRHYDSEHQALNIFYNELSWYVKNYKKIPKRDSPILEIANCGTGCVLMSKRVCIDMYKKYKNRAFRPETKEIVQNMETDMVEIYTDQDSQDKRQERYLHEWDWTIRKLPLDISEDLTFFFRAKDLGYKIYARLDAECYHYNGMPSKRLIKDHFITKE